MIVEHALLQVAPERTEAFEDAFTRARSIISWSKRLSGSVGSGSPGSSIFSLTSFFTTPSITPRNRFRPSTGSFSSIFAT